MAQNEIPDPKPKQMPEPTPDANAERKFLHDVATPLSVATGQLEILLDPEFNTGPLSDLQRQRLEKAKIALDKVRDMFVDRRSEITATTKAKKTA